MSTTAKTLSKELQDIAKKKLTGEKAAIAQRKFINANKEGNQYIFKNH